MDGKRKQQIAWQESNFGKELETDAAKREMRKKLYRNCTRDEVGKAVSRAAGTEEDLRERLDGDGKQFITIQSKSGSYGKIIRHRKMPAKGENKAKEV